MRTAFLIIFLCLNYIPIQSLAFHALKEKNSVQDILSKTESLKKERQYEASIQILLQYLNHPNDYSNTEITHLYIELADLYMLNGQYQKAKSIISENIEKQPKNLTPQNMIKYAYVKGKSFYYDGLFSKGLQFLKPIIDNLNIDSMNAREAIELYNVYASYFVQLGEYEKALQYYNLSVKIYHISGIKEPGSLSKYCMNLGWIYSKIDKNDSALKYYNEALNNSFKLKPRNHNLEANIYRNIGIIYKDAGSYSKAITYYSKAEVELGKISKNEISLNNLYNSIGNIHLRKGDYKKAREYYKKSLNLYSLHSDFYSKQALASLYNNLGNVELGLKNDKKAIHYFKQCLDERKKNLGIAPGGKLYGNLGKCYDGLNMLDSADYFYRQAIVSNSESSFSKAYLFEAYIDYAHFKIKNNFLKDAELLINQAYSIHLQSPIKNPLNLSVFYIYKSDLEVLKNNYDQALTDIHKALNSILVDDQTEQTYTIPENLDNNYSNLILAEILFKKANIIIKSLDSKKAIKNLDVALNLLDQAIYLTERTRLSYKSEESRLSLSSEQYDIYDLAIDIAYKLYHLTSKQMYLNKAFEFSEKDKASILLSSIRDFEAKNLSNISEDLIKEEQDIRDKIGYYENELYQENLKSIKDEEYIKSLEDKIFTLNRSKDILINQLEINNPDYYKLKYNTKVIDIAEIQSRLHKNQIIIEYSIINGYIVIFYISQNEAKLFKKELKDDFNSHLYSLVTQLSNPSLHKSAKEGFSKFCKSSFALYEYLIKPVSKDIFNKHLIIIPDGHLATFPFEVLITKEPDYNSTDYSSLSYLIKQSPISYSYSSTLLYNDFITSNKKKKKTVLAFAPEYKNMEQLSSESALTIRSYINYLSPITGAKEEVDKIIKIMKGKKFLGSEATEANYKANAADYDIIHLALHTLIDHSNPMYSKMVFAPPQDTLDDGFLNTFEIYNTPITARLAVLSACNTGVGDVNNGEGVISLARGFIYAGCPSIVMTLWSIEDITGSSLMSDFYKLIKKGDSKSDALRFSKIHFIENSDKVKAHPYFWAGYVCIGNTSPLYEAHKHNLYLILLLIPVVIAFIVFRRFNKKGRHQKGLSNTG